MAVTFLTNEDGKKFVKTINNVQPDENGNVKIAIESSDVDLAGYATEKWVQEGYQPKGNYLTEVPDGYATEEFVVDKIAEAELGREEVDLSGYAKKSELPTKPEDIGAQPAGNYALKTEIPSVPVQSVNGKTGEVILSASDVGALPNTTKIPSKISELTNDKGYLTEHQDISGKLDANKLTEAINTALAQAKDSGEFDGYTPVKNVDYFDGKDGEDGKTPEKGIDYFTEADKTEIARQAADLVDIPDLDEVYILGDGETLSDVPDGITVVIDPDGNPDFDLTKYVKESELNSAINTTLTSYAKTEDIPTDSYINSLIDTKLAQFTNAEGVSF